MTRAIRWLRAAETALLATNRLAVILMMMSMAALVFANVVSRYVFSHSLNWSEEIARYLMVWVTYVGAGLAMREGQHVAIEFGQSFLPKRLHAWVRGLVAITILVFLVIITVVGVQFSDFAWRQRTPVMQWPMGAMYLAVPIGSMLFALHFVAIARDWIQRSPGLEIVSPTPDATLQPSDEEAPS